MKTETIKKLMADDDQHLLKQDDETSEQYEKKRDFIKKQTHRTNKPEIRNRKRK